MQIEGRAVHGGLIDLEIAGVNDHAERRAHGQRNTIDGAVRNWYEFDLEGADFDEAAGHNLTQRRRAEKPRLVQAFFAQRQSEASSIHRNVQIPQDVGQGSDVVFVPVGQYDSADVRAVLLKIGGVGDDQIDAQEFGLWEHHSGVDDEDVVA